MTGPAVAVQLLLWMRKRLKWMILFTAVNKISIDFTDNWQSFWRTRVHLKIWIAARRQKFSNNDEVKVTLHTWLKSSQEAPTRCAEMPSSQDEISQLRRVCWILDLESWVLYFYFSLLCILLWITVLSLKKNRHCLLTDPCKSHVALLILVVIWLASGINLNTKHDFLAKNQGPTNI